MKNNTICFDFDGVIIKKQPYGDGELWQKPTKDCRKTIKMLSKNFKIVISSVRCHPSPRKYYKHEVVHTAKYKIGKMKKWLKKNKIYYDEITPFKPRAFIYVDDKGYRFTDMQALAKYLKQI